MNDMKVSGNKSLKYVTGVRIAFGVGGLLLLAALGPLIWAMASAGAGVIVLLLLASVGIGIFQSMPLVAQKWENKILELRRAEARKRPIETLMNYLKMKSDAAKNFKNAVVNIGTQIKSMAEMVEERKRTKPSWDPSKKEASIKQMQDAYQFLLQTYQNAEKALVELNDIIDEKKFDWKFGEAGGTTIEAINALNGEDLVEKMLADEAFDAIRDNFNHVFSALEVEAVKLTSNKSLSFDEGMVIDLSAIQIPTKNLVRS